MKDSKLPKLLKTNGRYPYDIYQFEDIDGNYSEQYWAATNYHNGFAQVAVTLKGDFQYRDMIGRITAKPTKSGKNFYKFYIEEISLKQIEVICFADKEFCMAVKRELIARQHAKAKEIFAKGEKPDKTKVQKEIERDFKYIDKMHRKAVQMKAEHEKRKKKTAVAPQAKTTAKPDYSAQYYETKDYLNGISLED
ncbi:MAG: hypothetical protein IJY90_00205 [Clostridia bacterium]|nr:hypothetical protein [Clostridia bacterium]